MRKPAPVRLGSEQLATFILCIDFELAWGWAYDGSWRGREDRILRGRAAVPRLLDLLDRFAIPTTWATVGHLFLDACQPVSGVAHPEVARPGFEWMERDWFSHDPGGAAEDHPLWFAPDLIEAVRSRPTGHEIASHSFSHLLFGAPGCTEVAAEADLAAAVGAAQAKGVEMGSFVYPQHRAGFVDILPRFGFNSYRAATVEPLLGLPGPLRKPLRFALRVAGVPPPPVHPTLQVPFNLPASMLFTLPVGRAGRFITARRLGRRAVAGIRRTEREGGLFQIYLHDHNLGFRTEEFFSALEQVLAFAAAERDSSRLQIMTMGAFAASLGRSGPQAPG